MTERELYKRCLLNGVDVLYSRIMLCNLHRKDSYREYKYQVHSEMSKVVFSEMFYSLDDAVDKFIELKNKVRRI